MPVRICARIVQVRAAADNACRQKLQGSKSREGRRGAPYVNSPTECLRKVGSRDNVWGMGEVSCIRRGN
jgi:hypothetical protein